MTPYKHYSFDLWMTLIRSNPVFKEERSKYFWKNFNSKKKSLAEVQYVFRKVDLMCNAINERTGGHIDAEEMYLMVISEVNESYVFQEVDLCAIYNDMEQLLIKYMPLVYCSNTTNVLSQVKSGSDAKMNLLSNTGFIKGSTLKTVLKSLELDVFFDFQIYSDEVKMSKPNKEIFSLMLERACSEHNDKIITAGDVLHIGDNELADVMGAKSVGVSALLINSNGISISNLLN